MVRIVGMGELVVTDKEEDILRTFALASCVAVTVYSPERKTAGMIHVVLPFPLDSKDRKERPGYFAETGIPLLIDKMCNEYRCRKEELLIHMYGGADSMRNHDIYRVGNKNIDAVKNILMKMGLPVCKADLRGNESRSLVMEVKTGSVEVYRQPLMA